MLPKMTEFNWFENRANYNLLNAEWPGIYREIIASIKMFDLPEKLAYIDYLSVIDLHVNQFRSRTERAILVAELTDLAYWLVDIGLPDSAEKIFHIVSPIFEISSNVAFPVEIANPYLSSRDIGSLMCTSSFFSKNLDLKKIKTSRIWEIFKNNHQLFFLNNLKNELYAYEHFNAKEGDDIQGEIVISPISLPLDKGERIKQISLTNNYIFAITSKNRICSSGDHCGFYKFNEFLELPNEIPEKVIGFLHYLILTRRGKLYGFGENDKGQLGLGENVYQTFPRRIFLPAVPKEISFGYEHSIVLCENNILYGFGSNLQGTLGLGKDVIQTFSPTPILLPDGEIPAKILPVHREDYYGASYTLVLSQNGKLYGFGLLPFDSQPDATYSPTLIPLQFKHLPEKIFQNKDDIFVQCQHGVIYVGDTSKSSVQCIELPNQEIIKNITIRKNGSLVLSENGRIYILKRTEATYALHKLELPVINEVAHEIVPVGKKYAFILCKSSNLYVFNVEFDPPIIKLSFPETSLAEIRNSGEDRSEKENLSRGPLI